MLFLLFERFEEVFKSVQPNLIHGRQENTDFTIRKSIILIPDKVILRNIAYKPPLVFAIGHVDADQVFKYLGIH